MTLEDWNRRYSAREQINDEPADVLVEAMQQIPPGRALDLACGAGRNAVWLARRGWKVVAVDGAVEAVRIVRETDARIDARVFDLESGEALPFESETFDLVTILYYLHRPLFEEAMRVVRPGGMIVTAVRTSGISPRFCADPGELLQTFASWEIVRSIEEGDIAELVARKPEAKLKLEN